MLKSSFSSAIVAFLLAACSSNDASLPAAGGSGGSGGAGAAGSDASGAAGAGGGAGGGAGNQNTGGAAGNVSGGAAGSAGSGAAGTGGAGGGTTSMGDAASGSSGSGGTPATDAGPADAESSPDSGAREGGAGSCGTMRPDLSSLTGCEGLVIGPEGTIYFSQSGAVGRLRPGGAAQKNWAPLPGATTVYGVALNAALNVVYAGSPTVHKIFKVTVSDSPTVTDLFVPGGSVRPNGLTVGEDGALYFSDEAAGDVYRVSPAGAGAKINTSPIPNANGVALAHDGSLYVLSYAAGSILKLILANGTEQSRTTVAASGFPNADGIAFDTLGRLYIGSKLGLSRVGADGKNAEHLDGTGNSANVEFGAGALNCKDVYYVNGGNVRRFANDTAGASVPWHVQ